MGQSFERKFGLDNPRLMRIAAEAPMLAKDHELALARRWRNDDDDAALAELSRSYLRLVIAMANRFRNYGLPVSDLVQEGMIGLMEAARRFEPERELRFSTYASWWIRSAMQDFVLRNWSIVRTGTTSAHKSLFFNLRRLRALIAENHDGPMSAQARLTVANQLGVRVADVETMEQRLSAGDHSLDRSVADGQDESWLSLLASDAPGPDALAEEADDREFRHDVLHSAMASLTARERQIIRDRQLTDEGATLATLGEQLGISKERVRQIEAQALDKLRQAVLARVPDPIEVGLVDR